jgi:hypothetical protein
MAVLTTGARRVLLAGIVASLQESGSTHWVTLKSSAGLVTHVCVDASGTITHGPGHLRGHNINHLPAAPPRTSGDTKTHTSSKKVSGDLPAEVTHHAPGAPAPAGAAHFGDDEPAGPVPDSSPESAQAAYGAAHSVLVADTSPEIHTSFKSWVTGNMQQAVAAYRKRFGNVINVDDARELSPDYAHSKESRTAFANAVQSGAGELAWNAYTQMLEEPPPPGKSPLVAFLAGGAGSGKSSAVGNVPGLNNTIAHAHIVFDSTMSRLDDAVERINMALAAKHDVLIAYVHRDAVDAFTNGNLPRAENDGRTVPIAYHAAGHAGAAEVIRALQEKYKGDKRVEIRAIDNSRGKGKQAEVPLSALSHVQYNQEALTNQLHEELEKAHHAGEISRRVYAATRSR